MKWQVSILFLSIASLRAADTPTNDAKTAQKNMQGAWKAEKAVIGGHDAGKEVLDKLVVEIKDNKVRIRDGSTDSDAEMKLDPSKKPAWIDLTPTREKQVIKGIYEQEGDSLKLCWTKEGKDRPTAFESKEGSETVLMVLKRDK
jgi:uncharacterized protein (TIGR03067 family)